MARKSGGVGTVCVRRSERLFCLACFVVCDCDFADPSDLFCFFASASKGFGGKKNNLARPITLAGKFKPRGLEQDLAQAALARERVSAAMSARARTATAVACVDRPSRKDVTHLSWSDCLSVCRNPVGCFTASRSCSQAVNTVCSPKPVRKAPPRPPLT